ncbi:MAG: putative DCC family thiol-disulfide oxidoreductase YuxK [Bacteriovoracaceae bacterium]|jgi:predicted DCC family thiol-disulfide oxidoreductase YuxK
MDNKVTLLYDSECSLCIRFKKALEFLDLKNKVSYRSIHEAAVYIDYPELSLEQCEEVIHLIDTEGKVHRGPEVLEFLIQMYPGVEKFSWLLDSESAKKAMGAFYDRLNDMRIMKKRKCYTCGTPAKKHKRKI